MAQWVKDLAANPVSRVWSQSPMLWRESAYSSKSSTDLHLHASTFIPLWQLHSKTNKAQTTATKQPCWRCVGFLYKPIPKLWQSPKAFWYSILMRKAHPHKMFCQHVCKFTEYLYFLELYLRSSRGRSFCLFACMRLLFVCLFSVTVFRPGSLICTDPSCAKYCTFTWYVSGALLCLSEVKVGFSSMRRTPLHGSTGGLP